MLTIVECSKVQLCVAHNVSKPQREDEQKLPQQCNRCHEAKQTVGLSTRLAKGLSLLHS